jgi:hypothetical protein
MMRLVVVPLVMAILTVRLRRFHQCTMRVMKGLRLIRSTMAKLPPPLPLRLRLVVLL